METQTRNDWLALDDEALLRQCRIDTARGTGPGGQKRNKTSTMVRLLHIPSNVISENDETRSQHQNRSHALRNLRIKIALAVRMPAPTAAVGNPPGSNAIGYALWLAQIIDALEAVEYKLSEASPLTGLTTAHLLRELAKTPQAWQFVNARRVALGMGQLKQNS